MITDYEAFIAHLKRTGRMKLLPRVLHELKAEEAQNARRVVQKETATEDPSLISGWRAIEDGKLTDRSGKAALLEIYRNVTR